MLLKFNFRHFTVTTKHNSANINCQIPKIANIIMVIWFVKVLPRKKSLMELYNESYFENNIFEGLPNIISHRGKIVPIVYIYLFLEKKKSFPVVPKHGHPNCISNFSGQKHPSDADIMSGCQLNFSLSFSVWSLNLEISIAQLHFTFLGIRNFALLYMNINSKWN